MKKTHLLLSFCSLLLLPSCGLFNKIKNGKGDNAVDERIERVIDVAKSKTGTPYKYGGTTDAGYDCSGLIFTSFKSVGLDIPRTSTQQATIGKDILMTKLRPGDLVFFATKKGDGKITHSGLVTEVKDKEVILFIHAANSGVREDNIYTPYYFNSFVKAKRPF
jgi:probable lipoprotein NlpC